MSIKTNYDFKGIQVPEAIIRVDRLWGSSKEGWTALVGVYTKTLEDVEAVAEKTEEKLVAPAIIGFDAVLDEDGNIIKEAIEAKDAVYETVVIQEAKEATTREVLNLIEEFNHRADFNGDERGYTTLYKSLHEKFGGIEC